MISAAVFDLLKIQSRLKYWVKSKGQKNHFLPEYLFKYELYGLRMCHSENASEYDILRCIRKVQTWTLNGIL